MKQLIKIISHFLPLIIIVSSIYWVFYRLPDTFFQQDEWQSIAEFTYYKSNGILGFITSLFPPDAISHFNPLAIIYNWFVFVSFYTNFEPSAWISIVLHALNAVLLYIFLLSFINKKVALIAALFFGLNSIPSQAVTWVAAANSYEIPAALILISLIFFRKFLVQKKSKTRNITLSFLMLLISLLFHENGIFLLIFYPVTFFLHNKTERKDLSRSFFFGIGILILVYLFIMIPFFTESFSPNHF